VAKYLIDEVKFSGPTQTTPATKKLCKMFGIDDPPPERKIIESDEIIIDKGQIVYITGASGAGKTLLLNQLQNKIPGVVELADCEEIYNSPVLDYFRGDLSGAIKWLSRAGMNDAFALLNTGAKLSCGQLFRFRLAKIMEQQPAAICIDNFCDSIDRVTAAVVAFNIRKFANEYKTIFIVASNHDDIMEELEPDVVVIKHLGSGCDIMYPRPEGDE